MANEKKKQISTNKKKTKETKAKVDNKKNVEEKAETKKITKAKPSAKTTTNLKNTSNKKEEVKKNSKKVTEKEKQNIEKEVLTSNLKNQKDSRKKEKDKKEIYKSSTKSEKVTPSSIVNSDEIGKLIKIILILVVIVALFYGLTVIITKFQKPSVPERNKNTTPAVIQYDEILIGTMLNQARDEYYVLIQKDDDEYQILTSYYLQRYSGISNSLKVYTANINSVFNQFYISETSNVKTNNLKDFRVSTVTLVKIKNHEIIEAYAGIEEVENAFKTMVNKK